jgi:hypothetical protein
VKIVINDFKKNPVTALRQCGYHAERHKSDSEELSFARRLGGYAYPKFHCYVKRKDSDLYLNLHLDQRKTSYIGSAAHGGEYDSELVREEAKRLKALLQE